MSNFGKNVPSKRKTKIVEQAIANSPPTAKNLAVYVYDFSCRDYRLLNPLQLKPAPKFPEKKLQLVCRDIRTNVKEFPRPRFEKIYLCKLASFHALLLIHRHHHRPRNNLRCPPHSVLRNRYFGDRRIAA